MDKEIVDRTLFNLVGGFDDRWFIRAMHEELFNLHINEKLATTSFCYIQETK